MRQRNLTGGPLVFPTLGLECEANGVIDPPDDLGELPGFELLDPPAPTPLPDLPVDPPADQPAETKPKTIKRAGRADDAGEA